ncbi:DDE domain-containing protein [Nitrosospira sp. Nsp11]|nr:DDE domain-containing protein [Nitrosospira sp. Nsp11]
MSDFKWRHFRGELILGCVRWYCKYGISYRDLAEMMLERGLDVDHTTLYRWVQHYAPEMEKRLRWYWKPPMGYSWRMDETYVKVKGEWTYLYRALDKKGHTIDFYLSATRNTQAAKRFLGQSPEIHETLGAPRCYQYRQGARLQVRHCRIKNGSKVSAGYRAPAGQILEQYYRS